jgi:hypothetical protein
LFQALCTAAKTLSSECGGTVQKGNAGAARCRHPDFRE